MEWFQENERDGYRAAVATLATRRRLRPVFVERKPRPERNAWLAGALSRKESDDAAREILQAWLLGAHRPMICAFLDALGVKHDGQGLLDELPPQPPAGRLAGAIDAILAMSTEAAPIYLHLFDSMDITDWPDLRSALATDPRLQPGAVPVAA